MSVEKFVRCVFNDTYIYLSYFLCKSICCWYSFELPRLYLTKSNSCMHFSASYFRSRKIKSISPNQSHPCTFPPVTIGADREKVFHQIIIYSCSNLSVTIEADTSKRHFTQSHSCSLPPVTIVANKKEVYHPIDAHSCS